MSGDSKTAATLFVLLGEETSAEVLRHLTEGEIEQISKELSTASALGSADAEKAAEKLYNVLSSNSFISEGGADYAKKVVLRTLGAGKAKRIMERLASGYAGIADFDSLERMNPTQVSQYIQNEHPQTIALVLANLSPVVSARLLEALPEVTQADVTARMSCMENVSPDVLKSIAAIINNKLKPMGNFASSQSYSGVRAVAELLNRMQRSVSRGILERIQNDDAETANAIRQLMFIFEDIALLDDAAIREILQRVDKKTIGQALKGASEQQQDQFFRNMSSRAVEMMREEMDLMGTVKGKDVHSAQQKIVEVVRQLEDEGIITIGGGGEENA